MKKNILIFCAVFVSFSLMSFGYLNWSNSTTNQEAISWSETAGYDKELLKALNIQPELELVYNVDSRFMTTITKEDLHKAKSIIDILPEKATKSIVSYLYVQVDIIDKASEAGKGDVLNAAQLELLQSADYSTDIYIMADYKIKNEETGGLQIKYLTYYITVIPEKEAEFASGSDALIEYLKENSKEKTAIIKQDKLQLVKINFTVTKEGTITNVKLDSTSGYPSVDESFLELIKNMPEKWNPATNSKGEKVDLELVFFFGLPGSGC